MVQEFFCPACEGYAVVEAKSNNTIRVTACNCQFEEEENALI